MKCSLHLPAVLLLAVTLCPARAEDFASLCADRRALELVYHAHRLGPKPPLDQAMPPTVVEQLVRLDQHKEAVLRRVYGVAITPALLTAEVQRINATTRAPDTLAEIKAALGNDPARLARTFAQPLLVERLLRERYDNDDALHAPQRREAESVRQQLLAEPVAAPRESAATAPLSTEDASASKPAALTQDAATLQQLVERRLALLKQTRSKAVTETTWQLAARPAETNAPSADALVIKQRFGRSAQRLSPLPAADGQEQKSYFEELPGDLQNVLRVQLRRPGDVSAVIETPGGFLLYVAKKKTDLILSVASLSLPKRNYEQWLAEKTQNTP